MTSVYPLILNTSAHLSPLDKQIKIRSNMGPSVLFVSRTKSLSLVRPSLCPNPWRSCPKHILRLSYFLFRFTSIAIYYFCLSNIFALVIGYVIPDFVILLVLFFSRTKKTFSQHIFLRKSSLKYNRKSYNAIRKLCLYMICILNPTFCVCLSRSIPTKRTKKHKKYLGLLVAWGR